MGLIITFLISLFALVVLFLAKGWEEKKGGRNFVTQSIAELDPFCLKIFYAFKLRYIQVSQTLRYIFLIVIPQRSEESFKEAKRMAVSGYKRQKDVLLGKKDIQTNPSASFYLKKIKEERTNGVSGRIEEENM